jgi:hypothetical protein
MKTLVAICIASIGAFAYASVEEGPTRAHTPDQTKAKRAPVIVELFTSEGCSSCPSADALLAKLNRSQPIEGATIIALEEHVDYWNHQGWRDPYSAEQFTERQNWYAEAFRHGSVYTPQMVVDGRTEFVGSHERKARQAIEESAKLAKTDMNIRISENAGAGPKISLEIGVEKIPGATPGDRMEVFIAITENSLHSEVARGENAGRKLDHFGVVRSLERIHTAELNADTGFSTTAHANISATWKRENLRVVVFLQERRSRHVLGAAEIPVR